MITLNECNYLKKFDLVSFKELFETLVKLKAYELGSSGRATFLVFDCRSPGAASGTTLVDAGTVIVDVGVQLHVPHHGHTLALKDLLDPLPEVAPDLVEVVVLLGRVRPVTAASHSEGFNDDRTQGITSLKVVI